MSVPTDRKGPKRPPRHTGDVWTQLVTMVLVVCVCVCVCWCVCVCVCVRVWCVCWCVCFCVLACVPCVSVWLVGCCGLLVACYCCCSLLLVEQLVNTSKALSEGRETRRSNTACSKGCSDIPMFGGECEEYEDWQYKVRIFLELSVLSIRNIPHVSENLHHDSNIGLKRPEGTLQNRSFFCGFCNLFCVLSTSFAFAEI